MKRFFEIQSPLYMPNVDYGVWGSRVGINPPGGFIGPTLASTGTITPTHPVHIVSGTSQIDRIELPWTGFQGELTLIASGAWTLASGNNISTALTAVASQAVKLVYDGTLWYPFMMD